MSYISAISRIARASGKLAFMDDAFQKIAEETLKKSANATSWKNIHKQNWKNIHRQIGDAFVKAEKDTAGKPFWKNLWNENICGFPRDLINAWKGNTGGWNVTKAIGDQVLKRLPIIFAAFELPHIFSAFKEEGLASGLKETVRSAINLTSSMAGFIVGQALIPIPILGGLIGAIGTSLIVGKGTDLLLGKSYRERKAEAEEAKQTQQQQYQDLQQQYQDQMQQMQQMQQANPYMFGNQNLLTSNYSNIRPTMTPQQTLHMQNMLYGGGLTNPMEQDFMSLTSGINSLGGLNYYA